MACIEWPVQGTISQYFGEPQPWGGAHKGIDIAAPQGASVVAPFWGSVEIVRSDSYPCADPANLGGCDWGAGGYGNYVDIRTDEGWLLRISHLESVAVAPGQRLDPGQRIGANGMTGVATGPHVHFEIRNPAGTPVDPYPYLTCDLELPGGPPPPPPPPPPGGDTTIGVSLCVEGTCSESGGHRELTVSPGTHTVWAGIRNTGLNLARGVSIIFNDQAIGAGLDIDPGGSWTRPFTANVTISQFQRLEAHGANAPNVATELVLHPSSPGGAGGGTAGGSLVLLGIVAIVGMVALSSRGTGATVIKKKYALPYSPLPKGGLAIKKKAGY